MTKPIKYAVTIVVEADREVDEQAVSSAFEAVMRRGFNALNFAANSYARGQSDRFQALSYSVEGAKRLTRGRKS